MKYYKKIKYLISAALAIVSIIVTSDNGNSAITSITLSPANPTVMSTFQGYYLAGRTYTFTINVIDPAATAWGDISEVRLNIPNDADPDPNPIEMTIGPLTGAVGHAVNVVPAGEVDATSSVAGTFNNFTVTFNVSFRWDTTASAYIANRDIFASATSTSPALNTLSDTKNVSYGICSTVQLQNFVQDGDAADGYVNPNHAAFNVTSNIIYGIPGGGAADALPAAEIDFVTGVDLLLDGISVSTDNAGPAVNFAVGAATVSTLGLRTWTIRVNVADPGGPKVTTNSAQVRCDRVEVTDVEFINGGGVSVTGAPARLYYRARNVAGAQIRVTARMNSVATVVGNTTVRVRDWTEGIDYDVVIANGTNTGVVNMSVAGYPTTPAAADNTLQHNYRVTVTSGGVCETQTENWAGPNEIPQPGNLGGADAFTAVQWDYLDPPGVNASPFNGGAGLDSSDKSASSITLIWPNLANADPDRDFYTYRVYYRTTLPGTDPWNMVDRDTGPAYVTLGTITTAAITITGLEAFVSYDFRLSAVDVFGNEVALANQPTHTAVTTAVSINVTLSDGISSYNEASFDTLQGGNPDPAVHPLRLTAIKVKAYIVTSGNLPDQVNVIFASNDSDLPGSPPPAGQYGVTGANDDILSLTDGVDRWTIACIKEAPNTWAAYLPTTHPLMTMGSNIRFIIETVEGGVPTWQDITDEPTPPGDHIGNEWRFRISKPTNFLPWPTRILNNVLTSRLPCCYPAYFLTFDALVTIRVYDVKGRVVATILDRAYRKGGQNIKDGGWCGTNKYNKKLGPGLYYMHITAKTYGGRVILDEIKKVVIAH